MKRIRYILRQGFTAIAVCLLVGMAPTPAFAETLPPTTEQTDTTQTPANGPTGPDAAMYSYNATSGLWENDYYTYDPASQATSPKVPLEYTCNPETNQWDTGIWQYSETAGSYVQAPVSLSEPPAGAISHPCPGTENQAASIVPETPTQGGPESSNESSSNLTNETTAELNTNVASDAMSGNAVADDNDDVGMVTSGNAQATANIFNLLQSQASFANPGVATFTANIQGTVTGDMLIDPMAHAQPTSFTQNNLNNATINNITNGTINNNIVLNATSGDASATNNDDVGGVRSGDATAIADVINMINAIVAANQSFIGTINIYGDYTGNILMPIDSLNALLASAGPSTSIASNTSITDDMNATINNNVNLGATSGTATAGNNDDVGSVMTGNAMTNLTILNLTGKQVVAANSLLVFVNVMGQWVGLIMDAPAGTTAAALGGGVTSNATLADTTNVTNIGNYAINNNITANATTGNATATNNDDIGSVATGNAVASVSLANLINSNFSLSNWFGVLFINVFGTWHGNFGVMKPPVTPAITSGAALPGGMGADATQVFKNAKVFAFVPTASGTSTQSSSLHLSPVTMTGAQSGAGGGSNNLLAKATAAFAVPHGLQKASSDVQQAAARGVNYWTVGLLTIGSLGLAYVAFERIRNSMRSRYMTKY